MRPVEVETDGGVDLLSKDKGSEQECVAGSDH